MGAEVSCPANVPRRFVQLFRQPGFCAPALAKRVEEPPVDVVQFSPGCCEYRLPSAWCPCHWLETRNLLRCALAVFSPGSIGRVRLAERRQLGCNRDKFAFKATTCLSIHGGRHPGPHSAATAHPHVTSRGRIQADENHSYRNYSVDREPAAAATAPPAEPFS